MLGGLPFAPKPRPCAHCGSSFAPVRMAQKVCSPVCASRFVKVEKAKAKHQIKTRKEAVKTIPVLIAEAQKEFNAYIRERDKAQACICCGRTSSTDAGLSGHMWDCGHYRSTGSASHLRFNEDNAHRQLVVCNRYGAGRAVDYRIGLVARIGLDRVEALERNNHVHKWTHDELRAIKAEYVTKLKQLKKENA